MCIVFFFPLFFYIYIYIYRKTQASVIYTRGMIDVIARYTRGGVPADTPSRDLLIIIIWVFARLANEPDIMAVVSPGAIKQCFVAEKNGIYAGTEIHAEWNDARGEGGGGFVEALFDDASNTFEFILGASHRLLAQSPLSSRIQPRVSSKPCKSSCKFSFRGITSTHSQIRLPGYRGIKSHFRVICVPLMADIRIHVRYYCLY